MKEKPRRMSLELERALLYRPGMPWYPPLATPYGPATPPSLQQVLRDLAGGGWKVLEDPCTGVLTRVAKPYSGEGDPPGEWTCTSDVTTGIF